MNALNKFLVFCLASSTALVAPGQAIAQNVETDFSDTAHTSASSTVLGSTQVDKNANLFFGGIGDADLTITLDPDIATALPGQQPPMTLFTSPESNVSIQSGYDFVAWRSAAVASPMWNPTYSLQSGSFGSSPSLLHQGPSVQLIFRF